MCCAIRNVRTTICLYVGLYGVWDIFHVGAYADHGFGWKVMPTEGNQKTTGRACGVSWGHFPIDCAIASMRLACVLADTRRCDASHTRPMNEEIRPRPPGLDRNTTFRGVRVSAGPMPLLNLDKRPEMTDTTTVDDRELLLMRCHLPASPKD